MINLFRRNRQPDVESTTRFVDISHQTFGKYQYCTQHEGVWYADCDFERGPGLGKPKIGAIPAPQETDRTPFGQKRNSVGIESEDEKRERWRKEEQETHELLERLALELVDDVIADQPLWFEKYNEEYERDVSGYSFECCKHGDFLTLFITRNANPQTKHPYAIFGAKTSERTLATTINLGLCKEIKFIHGHPPDLLGRVMFHYRIQSENGLTIGGTNFGNYAAPKNSRWVVRKPECRILHGRPLFVFDTVEEKCEGAYIDMSAYDYRIKTTVDNTARPAEDDRIRFEGLGATLYAPASLGEDIYQMILRTME